MKKTNSIFFFFFICVSAFAQNNVVADQTEFNALKALWEATGGSGWTNKTGWPTAGNWPSTATAAEMDNWYGITVGNGDIREIILPDNNLVGQIPSELSSLTKLESLRIQKNKLAGTIPSQFSSLVNMLYFYVGENKLTGQIPASFNSLTRMAYFDVHGNQLSGTVPSIFTGMTFLNTLYLYNNRFSGILPSLRGQNIDVSNNMFTGNFPTIAGSPVVAVLASNNGFTGFPSNIATLPSLLRFELGNNELTSVPAGLTGRSDKANIQVNISNNRLDFVALESMTGFKSTSTLTPQRNIRDYLTKTITFGDTLKLVSRPTTAQTTVKWYKQSPDGSWPTTPIATGATYINASSTKADEGIYQWRATSSIFTATIQSEPIQAKAATTLALDNWGFQYKYDGRNRMTHKKVPGADWVVMVYDSRDRLVMTQDGEQRKVHKWSFTKYDGLNRPVMTGVYTHNVYLSQEAMSALISTTQFAESFTGAGLAKYSNVVFPTSNTELLTITYYDNYSFIPSDTIFQYRSNQLPNQYKYNNTNHTSFPVVKGVVTGTKVRGLEAPYFMTSVNYYDNRGRVVQTVSENFDAGIDRVSSTYDFTGKIISTKTTNSVSSVTWKNVSAVRMEGNSIVKMQTSPSGSAQSVQYIPAGTDGWVEATVTETNTWRYFGLADADADFSSTSNTIDYAFYMYGALLYIYEKGVFKQSIAGGEATGDRLRISRIGNSVTFYRNDALVYTSPVSSTSILYAGVSMLTNSSRILNLNLSVAKRSQTTLRFFEYDHAGRLLEVQHSVNGNNLVVLSKNEYNEIGQLVDKKLHSADETNFHQSLDYRYNIRGWLTSVNGAELGDNAKNSDSPNERHDLFGMDLVYNDENTQLGNTGMYNGNISAMRWSTGLGLGEEKERAYKFNYDVMNRLNAATHKIKTSTWASSSAFHESGVTYDLNGNIKTLLRTDETGVLMDSLKYAYGSGNTRNNMLRKVADAGTLAGFADGTTVDDDYTYDNNGNMISDKNKNITAITYNMLNLPSSVKKNTNESILYFYDATGKKLSQVVKGADDVQKKMTDYHGEFIYENDTLKFANHEEGRVILTSSTPEYQYHLKDHLGNVRMTFTTKDEIVTSMATVEADNLMSESGEFLNYDKVRRINQDIFDHTFDNSTPTNGAYAIRLSGSANEKIGLAKSLKVDVGDTVKMEVYAKYYEPPTNPSGAFATLMASIIGGTQPVGTFIDGLGYAGSGSTSVPYNNLPGKASESGEPPKAYLNWLVFDKDYNIVLNKSGYKRITHAALEDGSDVAHERIAPANDILITEEGFVYIYLSNENESPVEVYFDDFKVEHVKSPVIQSQSYYPFGAEFDSFTRENGLPNQYKFNGGNEYQDELDLNVLMSDLRIYDPWGRLGWWQVDPKPEEGDQESWSTYQFSFSNPIRYNDPKGDCPPCGALTPLLDADAAVNPNGVGAHLNGIGTGISNNLTGLWNAVTHPVETAKGLGNLMLAGATASQPGMSNQVDATFGTNATQTRENVTTAVTKGANDLVNGNGQQRGQVIGGIVASVVGSKGINAGFGALRSSLSGASLFGNGVFGQAGLKIGGFKINGMYGNPAAGSGAGTIFSIKQMQQGGSLFRLDYGKLHSTGQMGLHSTVRFSFRGTTYGSTAQRTWYPSSFKPPFFKPLK